MFASGNFKSIVGRLTLCCSMLLPLAACSQKSNSGSAALGSSGTKSYAFVTNDSSDYWKMAKAGTRKAEKDLSVKCDVLMPANATPAEQQHFIEDVIARNLSGMAISPIDAANQTELLNTAVDKIKNVITQDSDAPNSKRLCYLGTNNYKAGRLAGKMIREIMPNGGTVVIFVGRLDAQNAIDRRQGVCEELAGKPESDKAVMAPNEIPEYGPAKLGNYTLLDTKIDQANKELAQQNALDILARFPDVNCLVGLYEYNGPMILEAVRAEKMQGKVKIVCFDENAKTLEGIAGGDIYGTVVQQPYEFGYQSVKMLNALAGGDASMIPASKFIEVPVKAIKKAEVGEFKKTMDAILAEGAK